MGDMAFRAGDEFLDSQWDHMHGQVIAVEDKPYTTLYEVKWADGEITYERADYLRMCEKI